MYDANGEFVGEEKGSWSTEGLAGSIAPDGTYTASAPAAEAGLIKVSVGSLSGAARVRVLPPFPWTYDFEAHEGEAPPRTWVHGTGRYTVRDLGGSKGLFRAADNSVARRVRTMIGATNSSNYTIEADVRASERRRQMGDVGVIAQRYVLVLFGNSQLHRAASVAGRRRDDGSGAVLLEARHVVSPEAAGGDAARGRRASRRRHGRPESRSPTRGCSRSSIAIGHREGSPGLYSDAGSDIMFDNIRVYANR